MRIKSFVPGAAIVFAASLSATVAFADGPQFVGVSNASFSGNHGYSFFHDVCDTAFSDRKRKSVMCTSQMIIENGLSPAATPISPQGFWVNPVFTTTDNGNVVDFSGTTAATAAQLNCDGWSDANSDGLIIISKIGPVPDVGFEIVTFQTASCGIDPLQVRTHNVACCK